MFCRCRQEFRRRYPEDDDTSPRFFLITLGSADLLPWRCGNALISPTSADLQGADGKAGVKRRRKMERGGDGSNNNKNNVKQEGSLLSLWLSNRSRATSTSAELFRRGSCVHTPGKDFENRCGANAGFQLPV